MRSLIHKTMERLASLLFPDRCVGCQKAGTLFCHSCKAKSRKERKENTSLPFLDKVYHWGPYSNKALQSALKHLKYHGAFGLSHPLSDMMVELLKPHLSSYSQNSIVIPIPTSKDRLPARGYNQAELLAQVISEKSALPFVSDTLIKTRPTKTQVELKGKERVLNVAGSFGIKNGADISGKTILLVDDISTTGATLSEAARVLKEAGAKEVVGLVVARG